LNLDFTLPEEALYERIIALKQSGVRLNLGIATPGAARLLVVETREAAKVAALNRFGDWRSRCWAHSEDGREQHYYFLPPGFTAPRTRFLPRFDIVVYGQEGEVLAPPSRMPEYPAIWQWAVPPWEVPPDPPGPALWQILLEGGAFDEHPDPRALAELPSWEEVFHRVEPFGEIIRALVAPADTFEQYYERILNTALGFVIADPTLLLALLWHAPRGDLKEYPARWLYLQNLAATAPARGLGAPAPEHPRRHAAAAWSSGYTSPGRSGPAAGNRPVPLAAAGGPPLGSSSQEIFSFLEKRVVLDRNRYESMISEMSELAAKAAELERRLQEQEEGRQAAPQPAAHPEPPPAIPARPRPAAPPPSPPPTGGPKGVQALFQEFLTENPDLAAPDRVQMLQFYLKNYIDINPENHGLPFPEKLAKAAKMVRDFLGM